MILNKTVQIGLQVVYLSSQLRPKHALSVGSMNISGWSLFCLKSYKIKYEYDYELGDPHKDYSTQESCKH